MESTLAQRIRDFLEHPIDSRNMGQAWDLLREAAEVLKSQCQHCGGDH